MITLEIYQKKLGYRKKINTLNLKSIKKGKNIIKLDKDFPTYLGNSKIIVKFLSDLKDNNLLY